MHLRFMPLALCAASACGGGRGTPPDAAPPTDAAVVTGATGPVHGTIAIGVAGRTTRPRGVEVWLEDERGEAGEVVTTDEFGAFRLAGDRAPGSYRICSRADGLERACDPAITLPGDRAVVAVPTIERMAPPGTIVARATHNGDSPCFDRMPEFDAQLNLALTINAGSTTREGLGNVAGEVIAFAVVSGPKTRVSMNGTCGPVDIAQDAVVGDAGAWVDITLPGRRPVADGIEVRHADGSLGEQVTPGETVRLTAVASDDEPLTYRWRTPGGTLEGEGASVAWTAPAEPASIDGQRIYVLVDDGQAGLAQAAIALEAADPTMGGQVLDEAGAPLAGATVRVGASEATTDDDGRWRLDAPTAPTLGQPTTVTIARAGFVTRQLSLIEPSPTIDTPLVACETVTFDPTVPSTLTAPSIGDGLQIDVPASAVLDGDAAVTAPVAACLRILDERTDLATGLAGPKPLPGDYARAPKIEVAVWLDLRDAATGAPLRLGQPATIRVSAPTGSSVPRAARPRVLQHDPATGRWSDKGAATFAANGFAGTTPGGLVAFGEEATAGCLRVWADRLRLPTASHLIRVRTPGPYGSSTRVFFPLEPGLNVLRAVPAGPVIVDLVPTSVPWGPALFSTTATVPAIPLVTDPFAPGFELAPCRPLAAFGGPMTLPSGAQMLSRRRLDAAFDSAGVRWSADALADAYYDTIDPTGAKATLGGWMLANGFVQPGQPYQTRRLGDAHAAYFNEFDLGFGRLMRLKITDVATGDPQHPIDRRVAMVVTNFSTLAKAWEELIYMETGPQLQPYHLGPSVAMEWSPDASGGPSYTKFYVYDANNVRIPSIDLDGAGVKAVPHLCMNCHGGSAPPTQQIADHVALTGRWPSADLGARFIPFALDTYGFDAYSPIVAPGHFNRANQEEQFRRMNEALLATNLSADGRRLVLGWYGQSDPAADTVPALATQDSNWRPPGTGNAGWDDQPSLYRQVIQPYCRGCHVSLGLTWGSWGEVQAQASSLHQYVCASQQMPHALRTWDRFWNHSPQPVTTLLAAMAGESSWMNAACPTP